MEERVKEFLDKEHSKRFKAMCHKNATIAHENQTLLDFFESERKKRLYELEREFGHLQKRMVIFSQEKLVNRLLNQLTDMAFQEIEVKQVESVASIESEEQNAMPRYLRLETNLFHPSLMSIGSTDSSLLSSNDRSDQDIPEIPEVTTEEHCETEAAPAVDNENELPEIQNCNDELSKRVKNVMDKLTCHYDIDRLKFLTQVMTKTLQNKGKSRYEDKMKLIYSLNKYINQDPSKKTTTKSTENVLKATGNSTFLFLRTDRQKELRKEAQHSRSKENDLHKGTSDRSRLGRTSQALLELPEINPDRVSSVLREDKPRRHSVPATLEHGIPALHEERRHSVLSHAPHMDRAPHMLEERRSSISATKDHVISSGDMMDSIYLNLGHGALLKLPQYTRAAVNAKQRFWKRRDLRRFPILPLTGSHDLRVVMKNCRYIRFPKDMAQQEGHLSG